MTRKMPTRFTVLNAICRLMHRAGVPLTLVVLLLSSFSPRARAQNADIVEQTGTFISGLAGDPSGQIYFIAKVCNVGTVPHRVGVATYVVDNSQPDNLYAQCYFDSMVVTLAPNDCVTLLAKVPSNNGQICSFQGDLFLGEVITTPFSPTNGYAVQGRELDGMFVLGQDCHCTNHGSISGRVWLDDCDGILKAGEPGLNNITVILKDNNGVVVGTTQTDINGRYTFSNLHPEAYSVLIDTTTLPPGLTPSFDVDGVASPNVAIVTIAANENRGDVNFGYCSNGRICGTLYCDDNPANGKQDAGEPGLPNVTVTLKDKNGNVIATTKTDANGKYCFSALAGGSYTVSVPNPANGLAITGSSSASVTIPTGGSVTQDFRYHGGKISGYAFCVDFCTCPWKLTGLQGVIISLKDANGNVITTVTDACGYFEFSDCVAAGCYKLIAPGVFNGHKILTCSSLDVCIKAGECSTCNWFAYDCSHSKICGTVFCDKDGDGKQDCNEPGISGVTVTLKDDQGNVVATTKSDSCGNYCFKGLNGGSYTVVVPVTANGAAAECTNKVVCLYPCDEKDDVDFGYKCGRICGKAYDDCHRHNKPDCDERGYGSVCVILKDCNDKEICRTWTDWNGCYKFDNCPAGNYKVCADTYCGWKKVTCGTVNYNLGCGENKDDCHFGYR